MCKCEFNHVSFVCRKCQRKSPRDMFELRKRCLLRHLTNRWCKGKVICFEVLDDVCESCLQKELWKQHRLPAVTEEDEKKPT